LARRLRGCEETPFSSHQHIEARYDIENPHRDACVHDRMSVDEYLANSESMALTSISWNTEKQNLDQDDTKISTALF
jgi:hypothetical protein